MARKLKVIITAEDQTRGPVKSAQANIEAMKKALEGIGQKAEAVGEKLNSSMKRGKESAKEAEQKFKDMQSTLGGIAKKAMAAKGKLALIAVAVYSGVKAFGALKNAIKATLDTAAKFEFLKTRLISMYQSVEKGTKVFEEFNKIAATTPFTLDKVVEAGANLRAFMGDAFSPEMVKILADLAAFMGRDIVEAASAMGRAFAGGAGAADVFRETGILTLIKMKTGINDLTKLTLPEFRRAMLETFYDPSSGIIGATDRLAKTIVGLESNVADTFTRIANAIGQKFAPAYKAILRGLISIGNTVLGWFGDAEDKLRDQRVEVLALLDVLKDSNVLEETRKEIIKKLNDEYGSYLGNIKLEKATLEDIEKLQENINKQMEKRIAIAVKEKMLTEQKNAAMEYMENLVRLQYELKKTDREIQRMLKSEDRDVRVLGELSLKRKQLQQEIAENQAAYRRAIAEMNKWTKEITQLEEELGIKHKSTKEIIDEVSKVPENMKKISDAMRKQLLQGVDQYQQELPKRFDEIYKEYQQLQDKINQLKLEALIQIQTKGAPDEKLLEQMAKLQERANALGGIIVEIYPKVAEKIDLDFQKAKEQFAQFADEELQLDIEALGDQDLDQYLQERLQRIIQAQQAEKELFRAMLGDRKDLYIEHMKELWSLLDEDMKKRLGGEAAFNEFINKLMQQTNQNALQGILRTAGSALQIFGRVMVEMLRMSGEQTEGIKALMAVQAGIDAYAAINRAFSSLPTPVALALSAIIAGITFANQSKIESTNVPKPTIRQRKVNVQITSAEKAGFSLGTVKKFAIGGIVPATGLDTQTIQARPGEVVLPRQVVQREPVAVQQLINELPVEQETTEPVQVNVSPTVVINAIDAQSVEDFVNSFEFKDAFSRAIDDGLINLRVKGKKVVAEV